MNPVWFILSIILLPLTTVQAVIYKKPGDTVVLSPGSVTLPITSITWKHNLNLAAEWYGGDAIDFYREFRGRCELNTETGELTIPNLTLEDSGSYTPEINNRVLATTEVKIISGVSKPNVSENCDAEKTHCVLTCEGITADSEPVTYTWWSGDVMKSETKELIITKNDTEPSFTCKLENPVSSERSREVLNPLIPPPTPIPAKVPKPTVSMSCDNEKTHCVLTCEGNTRDSEPVTYTWWSGDVVKSQTKEFKITKKNKEASFVCMVKYLFGSESSKAVDNPFATNYYLFWIRAILVALFLVVGVGVIVFYTHKGNKEKLTSVDLEEFQHEMI